MSRGPSAHYAAVELTSQGAGAPALLFVHSGASDRTEWREQVNALTSRFRVLTFDLPGHGESALPPHASIEALAHAVGDAKSRAGSPCILIGHGMGCRFVLEAFRQSPHGIAGLVLIEGSRIANGDAAQAREQVTRRLNEIGIDAFLETAFQGMFVPNSDPELKAQFLRQARKWDRNFAQELLLSAVYWDAAHLERALTAVNVPLLVLQSTTNENMALRSLDAGATSPWMQLILQHHPAAEMAVMPGLGHFLQIEAAAWVNDQIARFAIRALEKSNGGR